MYASCFWTLALMRLIVLSPLKLAEGQNSERALVHLVIITAFSTFLIEPSKSRWRSKGHF